MRGFTADPSGIETTTNLATGLHWAVAQAPSPTIARHRHAGFRIVRSMPMRSDLRHSPGDRVQDSSELVR